MTDYLRYFLILLSSKAVLISMGFVMITALAWLKYGSGSLSWGPGLRRSGAVNVGLVVFNGATLGLVLVVTTFLLDLMQSLPHVPEGVWWDMPWIIQAFTALFILDFTNYWLHRWAHANAWFWPLHAVHHSDTDLHFLSSQRAHILEWVVTVPLVAGAAFLCGLSVEGVAFLILIRELHQFYVHSGLDWSHGPFRHVIAGPRFHRWHHVDLPEAHNKNFSLFFPFIDMTFGTYYVPGPARGLATGFEDNPGDRLIPLLLYPFRSWVKLASVPKRKRSSMQAVD